MFKDGRGIIIQEGRRRDVIPRVIDHFCGHNIPEQVRIDSFAQPLACAPLDPLTKRRGVKRSPFAVQEGVNPNAIQLRDNPRISHE